MSLRDQDALDLAQDLVRIRTEFEHMRQDHEVGAVRREGQGSEFAQHIDRAGFGGLLAQWNPAGMEKIALRQAELERVEAEDIGNGVIHAGGFPLANVASLRCFQPVLETRN